MILTEPKSELKSGTGFPYYIYRTINGTQGLIVFDLTLASGDKVQAYPDTANQYSADGPCWRCIDTRRVISRYTTMAWTETDKIIC